MEYLLPITTFPLENPDFNKSDLRAEFERYVSRQRAIALCLEGRESPDVVLDMLAEHSINVDAYVSAVEENIEDVIASGGEIQLWG